MSYSLGLLVICVIAMATASPVKEEEDKTLEKRNNCGSGCPWKGRCVPANQPWEERKCQMYMCTTTRYGGWSVGPHGGAKCQDYRGRCVSPGSTFSKYGSNGYLFNNCRCYPGGGYQCRG